MAGKKHIHGTFLGLLAEKLASASREVSEATSMPCKTHLPACNVSQEDLHGDG